MDPIFVIRGLSVRVLWRTEPMRGRYIYIDTDISYYIHAYTHTCMYVPINAHIYI